MKLYDTTLRDGMQGQGMSLSATEKVRVAEALDRLGVHYIEAGFPSSNPKEAELFRMLAGIELENAEVCAFGMTRRRGAPNSPDGLEPKGHQPLTLLGSSTKSSHSRYSRARPCSMKRYIQLLPPVGPTCNQRPPPSP